MSEYISLKVALSLMLVAFDFVENVRNSVIMLLAKNSKQSGHLKPI